MKKTFPLHVPGKEDLRVVEAIKQEIIKYVKREKRKTLPPEADFWYLNCKVGSDHETASLIQLPDVPKAVEAVALAGGDKVYVEILASAGNRVKKSSAAPHHRRES
jgi:hypothetical protein